MLKVVVVHRVKPGRESEAIGRMDAAKSRMEACDGFVARERFAADGAPGVHVTVTIWRDRRAYEAWLDVRGVSPSGDASPFENIETYAGDAR
jgi:heme-degrading monooxygenase HmoA